MSGAQKEPKELSELRDAFTQVNERLREQLSPITDLMTGYPRVIRLDAAHLDDEQHVFEVDGGLELTHAVLRGHPLAFKAMQEQIEREAIDRILVKLRSISEQPDYCLINGNWDWLECELREDGLWTS